MDRADQETSPGGCRARHAGAAGRLRLAARLERRGGDAVRQTNSAPGGFVAPGNDFDSFMSTVRSAGAQPIVIANYGTGTPQEAADWVRYANVTKGYGARYWEIGNEVYGNGFYGAQWEADQHADKSPAAYAANAAQYITAMKAVDPSIKVGVVVTTPGFWPDGVVGPGSSADWNHTVLPVMAPKADFVVFHWYPGGSSPADMLTKPSLVAGAVSQLRALINQFGGAHAPDGGRQRHQQPRRQPRLR
jgi:alpha-L-arabinofuranosidase